MKTATTIVALALCVACDAASEDRDAGADASQLRPEECCANADCAPRGADWVCDPTSRRCYRPGECDTSDTSLAPCRDGCLLGRCACSRFLDADGCRPEETCDRVPGRPEELACRAAQIACVSDFECPRYYRCEPYRSGRRCMLDDVCGPVPLVEGCAEAALVEPGAYRLDEIARIISARFVCSGIDTDAHDFAWYRLRVPPRSVLHVDVQDTSSELPSWWAVVFLESCEHGASCTAFLMEAAEPPSYANDGSTEREVRVAITKPHAVGFEITFTVTESGP